MPLQDCFDIAAVGITTPSSANLITRYSDPSQNLRTTFEKIIKRAKLKPWPKLFQNLRASRATELVQEFPMHVAAAWLGHSVKVAAKHYWQVLECHYEFRARSKIVAYNDLETGSPDFTALKNPVKTGFFNASVAVEGFEPPARGL